VNSSFQFDADGVSDLQVLWQDGERVLCRGWRVARDGGRSAALALAPAAERPPTAVLDRLAHEYELRDELEPAWAARPLALSHKDVKPANILANCPDGRGSPGSASPRVCPGHGNTRLCRGQCRSSRRHHRSDP
jgi:hypothetical protein